MSKVKRLMEEFGEFEVTETEFWYWFHTLNEEVFEGVVPQPHLIETCMDEDKWAYVATMDVDEILVVGLYIRTHYENKRQFVEVLAHEMVHLWQIMVNGDTGNHNKHFYGWRDRFEMFNLNLRREC